MSAGQAAVTRDEYADIDTDGGSGAATTASGAAPAGAVQGRPDPAAPDGVEGAAGAGVSVRAVLAVVAGLVGMLLVFGSLDRIWGWSAEYGRAWVFLGYFLVLSVLGRLFWWGVDTLITLARSRGQD